MKDSWDKVSQSELQVPRGRWNAKMRCSLFHIAFLRGRSHRDGQVGSDFLEKAFKRHGYFVYFLWECLPLFYRDVFHFKGSIIYSNEIYN